MSAHAETPRPTPRTDAAEAIAFDYYKRHREPGDQPFAGDHFDIARQLETELQAERLRGSELARVLQDARVTLCFCEGAFSVIEACDDFSMDGVKEARRRIAESLNDTTDFTAHAEGKHQAI